MLAVRVQLSSPSPCHLPPSLPSRWVLFLHYSGRILFLLLSCLPEKGHSDPPTASSFCLPHGFARSILAQCPEAPGTQLCHLHRMVLCAQLLTPQPRHHGVKQPAWLQTGVTRKKECRWTGSIEETWTQTLHQGSCTSLVQEVSASGSATPWPSAPCPSPAPPSSAAVRCKGSREQCKGGMIWHIGRAATQPRATSVATQQRVPGPGWLQPHAAPSCQRQERGRRAGRGFDSPQEQMLLIEPLSYMPSCGMSFCLAFRTTARSLALKRVGVDKGEAMCIRLGIQPDRPVSLARKLIPLVPRSPG